MRKQNFDPQGNTIRDVGAFTWADGTTGKAYDVVFATDQADTVYRGESGLAAWSPAITVKGFGTVTDLSVAIANDFDLADNVAATAAAMTVADLHLLATQVGDVLGQWGMTQNLTHELDPVLVSGDGKTLLDRAVYVGHRSYKNVEPMTGIKTLKYICALTNSFGMMNSNKIQNMKVAA